MDVKALQPIDEQLHRRVKIRSALEGITITEFVDRALREALERREQGSQDTGAGERRAS